MAEYKTITAKFPGQCNLCGEAIRPGQSIRYAKGLPTQHAGCKAVEVPADAIRLSVGQGYAAPSFGGWTPGEVIVNPGRKYGSSASRSAKQRYQLQYEWEQAHHKPVPELPRPFLDMTIADEQERYRQLNAACDAWRAAEEPLTAAYVAERDAWVDAQVGGTRDDDGPEFLYILTASKRYYREDGMSFGVGDESGYVYSAVCRPATDEEAAPVRQQRDAATARLQAAAALTEAFDAIVHHGEYPEGNNRPEGDTIPLGNGMDLYGGGRWFVVGPDWIWAVINNGGDGDNWSANNIGTGGAGAIGRRVPSTAELAARIRALAAQSNEEAVSHG